jgi:membrane protein
MKQAEEPLYPKLSSIYNKILQLASAILLIIVLMSILQSSVMKHTDELTEHFNFIAKQQLQQAIVGTTVILEQDYKDEQARNVSLQQYFNGLAEINFVKQIHLYDVKGLLVVSSLSPEGNGSLNNVNPLKPMTINELYGISPEHANLTDKLTPFVEEIRHSAENNNSLHGYLRFTIEPAYLTNILAKADEEQRSLQHLMLLLAGVVGFLLTRGLNRFSRRGYRLSSATDKS